MPPHTFMWPIVGLFYTLLQNGEALFKFNLNLAMKGLNKIYMD